MTRIYHSSLLNLDQVIILDKIASHHLIRVLRARKGSEVTLFNGDGHEYPGEILDESPKHCQVRIKQKIKIDNESSLNITLLQGISRSDRMDTCIQKSIELGVCNVTPLLCQRTGTNLKGERAEKKLNHWQQIAISACEQSGRCIVPVIQPAIDFMQGIQTIGNNHKLILAPGATNSISTIKNPEKNICILIGPEGGFTLDEIQQATDNGFTSISLGPRILRTETAGPACIAVIQALWGDLG
ncbi:MAG: 16S rRNA (uracil(1498)-N(3))-methyltransferase [Gammaproteobacteria bacterium]|nr:16S rRNA (uracil(1498)-N(3))-methyltransferase [Gammaproteobacteria bacterium]